MYTLFMRRIQLYIEEELDERLGIRAARAGVSKASLIREAVAERYGESAPEEDPLDSLIGSLDVAPGSVDDVVYGPGPRSAKGVGRQRRRRRS
jgi:hypothetical protein